MNATAELQEDANAQLLLFENVPQECRLLQVCNNTLTLSGSLERCWVMPLLIGASAMLRLLLCPLGSLAVLTLIFDCDVSNSNFLEAFLAFQLKVSHND